MLAPTGVPVFYPPPVLPDWGKVLSGRAQETSLPVPQPGRQAKQPPVKKESARAKAARERAAALKAQKGARDEEDEEDADEEEEMDEAEVLKTMGKGSFTAEEIRRQRRCVPESTLQLSSRRIARAAVDPTRPSRAAHTPARIAGRCAELGCSWLALTGFATSLSGCYPTANPHAAPAAASWSTCTRCKGRRVETALCMASTRSELTLRPRCPDQRPSRRGGLAG